MNVPTVALWEAVALVHDIDPDGLRLSSDRWLSGSGSGPIFEPHSFPSPTKYLAFEKATDFAERAANATGPIYLRNGLAAGGNRRAAQVSLAEVVDFFVSCEWKDIPAPLMQLVGSGVTEAFKPEQPLDASPVRTIETPKQRRARLLEMLEAEVLARGERGALARVTKTERQTRPTADRSNIGREIRKARQERDAERRSGWFANSLK
jgi:hypothetical protein